VSDPQQWEYHILKRGWSASKRIAAEITLLGADGWELVAIDALNGYLYFKRPKR
jgi:hypothetical protein